MKKRIIVRGPLLSRSGYGEQSRFALRALKSREDLFDIYMLNTAWGATGQISDRGPLREWINQTLIKTQMLLGSLPPNEANHTAFDISLQITIPNEFEKMAPVNVGYTAGIETSMVAPEWIQKSNMMMDRLITISNHSKKVFMQTNYKFEAPAHQADRPGAHELNLKIPIDYVGYPIRTCNIEAHAVDIDLKTEKNFLVIAQWGHRKNLDNTIRWFVEEFKDDSDVGLIIKTNNASDSLIDREATFARMEHLLTTCPEHKCKIYLIHGELSENELVWLYAHPTSKGFISLAHGEGFGLPIFEAACNGLPIITVTWGGQLDFISIPNKKGKASPKIAKVDYDVAQVQPEVVWPGVIVENSMWSWPREWSYKRALRDVLNKEKHYRQQAHTLQKHVLKTFTTEKQNDLFVRYVLDGARTSPEALKDKVNAATMVEVIDYE